MSKLMDHHLGSRRMILALVGVGSLTYLGAIKELDVSMAIAGIVVGVAGANALETMRKPSKPEQKVADEDIK